jgi:hypothetical protein
VTEAEYDALTAACDALLTSPTATADRIALAWLHVLNEHPYNLTQYDRLFGRQSWTALANSSLRRRGSAALALAGSVTNPMDDLLPASMSFPPQLDVLFISHIISRDAEATAPDFYYGTLPDVLAQHGVTSLLVLHNHFPVADRGLRERLTRGGPTARVVMPRWSTPEHEWRQQRRARAAGRALLEDPRARADAFAARVAHEAARHAASPATLTALRVGRFIRELCARFRPRALIATWEGHAWERVAFAEARAVDPAIRCIGYQHTVLFARSHGLRRSLGRAYDPDAVLTLGEVTRDALNQSDGLEGVPIMIYGSHRRQTASAQAPNAPRRCLVIPDGLESECLILFDFALEAARELPDVEFRLRMHPYYPFADLMRRYPHLKSLPPNVEVSEQADIVADFAECGWALYRGSSASVHAVLMGVRPLYLQRAGEIAFDPLFALCGWRQRVDSVAAFGERIAADRAASPEARLREWDPARTFCDRYVVTPNPDVVRALVTGTA